MNDSDREFYNRFKDFTGFADDFSDPEDALTEDQIARRIRIEATPEQRAAVFTALLNDTEKLLSSIDLYWEPLKRYLNRGFPDAQATRTWLLRMKSIWEEERLRLRGLR